MRDNISQTDIFLELIKCLLLVFFAIFIFVTIINLIRISCISKDENIIGEYYFFRTLDELKSFSFFILIMLFVILIISISLILFVDIILACTIILILLIASLIPYIILIIESYNSNLTVGIRKTSVWGISAIIFLSIYFYIFLIQLNKKL